MLQLESNAQPQPNFETARKFEFDESLARSSIWLSGQVKKETVDGLDADVVKELYYRGSWMADKLDEMIEGRCKKIGIPFADECEARFYHSQLRFGDLEAIRYSETKNPERTFELEFMLNRYIQNFMAEPAGEETWKVMEEEYGVVVKSSKMNREEVFKIADGLKNRSNVFDVVTQKTSEQRSEGIDTEALKMSFG